MVFVGTGGNIVVSGEIVGMLKWKHHSLTSFRMNGGDDGTRTRGLCRDSSKSDDDSK